MQIEQETNTEIRQPLTPNNQTSLNKVTLRQLRIRNKVTENAIQVVQSRISYMKNKDQKTVKQLINTKRKLNSLDQVRNFAKHNKELYSEERRRMEQNLQKKAQFNKLVKDHLKYNKKIVMTLMNHKINQEAKHLDSYGNMLKSSLKQQNLDKVNKVRIDHIEAQQKKKIYFLDKLQQFKKIKQRRLKEQLRERERQESIIQQLQDKQKELLERLSISEKFKKKCQQQYQQARKKYHSFYQASRQLSRNRVTRNISRDSSIDEDKAEIFIS